MSQVGTDLSKFREEWDHELSQINLEACRARKNNIIFQGIPGGDRDHRKALRRFMTLCKDTFEMPPEWLDEVDVNECYRFPPKGAEGVRWPLFVSLAKSRHREDLYLNAFKLKDTGWYMRKDLAPCLVAKRKELQKESFALRKAPHNFDTHLRDTAFKVWLEFKRPNSNKWEIWKGKATLTE